MREDTLNISNLASKHAKSGRNLDKVGVVFAMLEHANPIKCFVTLTLRLRMHFVHLKGRIKGFYSAC